jgi:hypothetical protein
VSPVTSLAKRSQVCQQEARLILAKILSFIFSFGLSQLDEDLDEEFKDDDTWTMLIEQLYVFAREHGPRVSARLMAMGGPVGSCNNCGQDTVDLVWKRCSLCGHEYERDQDEPN